MTLSTSSRLEIKPDHQIDININQHYLLKSSPSVYPPLRLVESFLLKRQMLGIFGHDINMQFSIVQVDQGVILRSRDDLKTAW